MRAIAALMLFAIRIVEAFNRYLLREHLQCAKDSHNFLFDRLAFGVTSSFTFTFWFKFQSTGNLVKSPLVSFSRTEQSYAGFSLGYDLPSLGALDFRETPIMQGIYSSTYMAESTSAPEITGQSRLNWVFVTVGFQMTGQSGDLYITANLSPRVKDGRLAAV